MHKWIREFYELVNNQVVIKFDSNTEPIILNSFDNNVGVNNIYHLLYTENRIALYVNYVLNDEDWIIGNIESINIHENYKTLRVNEFLPMIKRDNFHEQKIAGIEGWKPTGYNTYAGDCMPFSHNGVFHLFYLFDRRHHKSKWGLGAHQWAHLSTTNFIEWTQHPMAISIDHQYEGSICTGSVMECKRNGKFYAYYAIRMSDKSPARLTYSISDDCINFVKTDKFITLKEPFEPVSARDPKIIFGNDGKFHMFVTTSYGEYGALAHLISDDLENWEQSDEPIIKSKKDEWQPECPDYFYYNGWYYLIYSPKGCTRYVMSREPFGAWIEPNDNIFNQGSRGVVPKTAIFDNRIIIASWIPVDGKWGGTITLSEAIQNDDGTLRFIPFEI